MIYRYSGWDSYTQDAIKNRYFWFSKPTNFNDPLDPNMDCFKAFKLNENSDIKGFVKYIKEKTDNFGVLCFTEKTNSGEIGDKGFNNSHFWSHYADFHKGIALGFDSSTIETYYSDKLSCQADLAKVKYRTEPLNLDKDNIVLEEGNNYTKTKKASGILSNGGTDKERDTLFTSLLFSKDSRIWGIENESRIVLGGFALAHLKSNNPFTCQPFHIINAEGYKIPYPEGDILKEITFGVKFPQIKRDNTIKMILKNHNNVKFYQGALDFSNGDILRTTI